MIEETRSSSEAKNLFDYDYWLFRLRPFAEDRVRGIRIGLCNRRRSFLAGSLGATRKLRLRHFHKLGNRENFTHTPNYYSARLDFTFRRPAGS
jgi:hypothetical protein